MFNIRPRFSIIFKLWLRLQAGTANASWVSTTEDYGVKLWWNTMKSVKLTLPWCHVHSVFDSTKNLWQKVILSNSSKLETSSICMEEIRWEWVSVKHSRGSAFQPVVLEIFSKLMKFDQKKQHQILSHHAILSGKHLIGNCFIFSAR